jgi:hypothetical protein
VYTGALVLQGSASFMQRTALVVGGAFGHRGFFYFELLRRRTATVIPRGKCRTGTGPQA